MRKPRSKTTSRFATSPSSACAPSIPSSAPIGPSPCARRAIRASRSARERTGTSAPCERAIALSSRSACSSARPSGPRQANGESCARPSSVSRSKALRSLRSMLRPSGHDGHGGEELEPDAALLQARQIDVADAAAPHEIAAGEQRIGVHVGDEARRVERARRVARPPAAARARAGSGSARRPRPRRRTRSARARRAAPSARRKRFTRR